MSRFHSPRRPGCTCDDSFTCGVCLDASVARRKAEENTYFSRINQIEINKTFEIHWLSGQTEIIEGKNIANAMTNAGYGAGAVPALDYFKEIKTNS